MSAVSQSDRPSRPHTPDAEVRRQAFLRKLGGGPSPVPQADSSTPPRDPLDSDAKREAAADDLRRRYEERLAQAKESQIAKYIEAANQSLEDNNPVAAANALRIALSLQPDDLQLAARFQQVQGMANAELAETYRNQARYEERSCRYAEAARSYARAAEGSDDGSLYERAAHCLLEAGEAPRQAVEYARQALALAPENADVRVTLARAYLASDLRQSAIAELERASVIAPNDDRIKDWLERIRRHRA